MEISEKNKKFVNDCENKLNDIFKKYDELCDKNSLKIIQAFHNNKVSEIHFNQTTGYGYDDLGRDVIEKVFSEVLDSEDCLVRNQLISGSHALNVTFFSLLRPNDILLTITGLPYDTLHEVIGIKENNSSLKSFGIKYKQIDLVDGDFDYIKIKDTISNSKIKVIHIQRSSGYSNRECISIEKIDKITKFIKNIDKNIIIMVDNCYCELVADKEPTSVGVDIMVGSLIKNLGGGIAPNGAYIAGKKEYVALAAERLTLPGEGKEVGPSLGINKLFLQGLYLSPSVVNSSLKIAVLTSYVLEKLNYSVSPKYDDQRHDIVQRIIFNDEQKLIKYSQSIQASSPIDGFALPTPSDMPGYEDQIIMASGSFTQGSSIELSCDGPIRKPYIAYQQGGLTYNYGKLALIYALDFLNH